MQVQLILYIVEFYLCNGQWSDILCCAKIIGTLLSGSLTFDQKQVIATPVIFIHVLQNASVVSTHLLSVPDKCKFIIQDSRRHSFR